LKNTRKALKLRKVYSLNHFRVIKYIISHFFSCQSIAVNNSSGSLKVAELLLGVYSSKKFTRIELISPKNQKTGNDNDYRFFSFFSIREL